MTTAQLKKALGCVVEVCWNDAHSCDPWTPIDSPDLIMEGLPCRNYGICIAVNAAGVMLSAAINGSTDVGGSWFIPAGMITQVNILMNRKGERP
jgi:hypothetical protein